MLLQNPNLQIWLYAQPTDMRKQFDGLAALVKSKMAGKLDTQDSGVRSRGRALSDGGVRAKFYHAVSEAKLRKIIKIDLKSEFFSYQIDESALALARAMGMASCCWSPTSPTFNLSRLSQSTNHWPISSGALRY